MHSKRECILLARTSNFATEMSAFEKSPNPLETVTLGAKQTCYLPTPKGLSPRRLRQFLQLRIGDGEFGEAPAALAGAKFAKGRARPPEFGFV